MGQSLLTKIISGSTARKTRLHDEKGNLITLDRAIRNLPKALATGILRATIGWRPAKPWISYDATKELEAHLNKKSRVLEFGSGMSTLWYAERSGEVCSVEDYQPWHEKVKNQIELKGLHNIEYKLALSIDEYTTFKSSDNQEFDLIMIDGNHRSACLKNAAGMLAKGGIIYLDNSDKDSQKHGDMREAEAYLNEIAEETGSTIQQYTDIAPTQFFVQQGMLLRKPK